MDRAPDRYRFVLGAPIVMELGTRWIYGGGATALLARIVAKAPARPCMSSRRRSKEPLGIGPTEWLVDSGGVAIAASGARVSPRALARIGIMMLAGGVWRGRHVVPAS